MLRWLFRFFILSALGALFFLIGFREAPDLLTGASTSDILAASAPGRAGAQPDVRVLVAEAVDHALLTINGRIRIEGTTMQMRTRRGEFSQAITVDVSATGRGIKLGSDMYVRVSLKPLDGQPVRIAWQGPNGQVSMNLPHEVVIYGTHVQEKGRQVAKVRILSRLPMEEYLYGVVAGEVPTSWPLEALRAQAVASRSYAYFAVRTGAGREFDVRPDTNSQVWRPAAAVEPAVRRAVDSTVGVVVTENNALVQTYFHSECGGFTADARWVFTTAPVLALSGVKCPRCSDKNVKPTPWSVTYSRKDMGDRLKAGGLLKGGEIAMIQALDQNGNAMRRLGRAATMEIILAGGSGTSVKIPANEFRRVMGRDRKNIASTYMAVEGGDEPRVVFSGLGWGHGVGLCQYGAAYCAERLGYDFLDILALYYPGSKPVRLWGAAPRAS